MYLFLSALYWILFFYAFSEVDFIRICCCFTMKNHDVLLDSVEPHNGDPMGITLFN